MAGSRRIDDGWLTARDPGDAEVAARRVIGHARSRDRGIEGLTVARYRHDETGGFRPGVVRRRVVRGQFGVVERTESKQPHPLRGNSTPGVA